MGTEEDQKNEERKGFAGLSTLVSDVDTLLPPPAKQEAPRSTGSSGAEGSAESQQSEPKTKQPPYQAPAQSSSGSSSGKWGLGIAAVVIGGLWLIGVADKSPSSPAPSYNPPALNTAPGYSAAPTKPQVPSRPDEAKPPVGQNLVFSTSQIRYCLAEDIRMDAAKAVLNNYSDSDVDRFNAMVADYNSRCGSYRYRNGALEGARRDIEPYRGQLQTEGRSRFAHSPSADSPSAPATATGQWQQPQAQRTTSDADLEKQHWDYIRARVPDANKLIADPRLLPWVKKSPIRQRYYEKGTAYEVVQLLTDFKLHLASLPQNAPVTAPERPAVDETVRAVQQKLNELGYSAGLADGLMGRGTRAAIIAFQQDRGLAATGAADQALLLQLQQAPSRSSRPQPDSRPATTSVQLSAAESASLEAACSTDKYVNGPAAYRACVERQKAALAAGVRRPNLSALSSAEQQSIEAACSTDKYVNGPAAYNECLADQLAAMSGQGARRPDLSRLSSSERQSIEAACSTDKYVNGPAAYNRCLNNQLVALERQGGRPDLSRLSTTERNSIEAACSTDKYVNGPAAYNRCLSQQLARLRN